MLEAGGGLTSKEDQGKGDLVGKKQATLAQVPNDCSESQAAGLQVKNLMVIAENPK